MAAQRPGVLLGAPDAELGRDLLGAGTERLRPLRGNFGLTSRQPTVVDTISIVRGSASSGFGTTYGARLMPSTPPATTSWWSPTPTARAACTIASAPDAQSRLTVTPGTLTGSPASSAAIRPTLRFSSPAPLALPRITSSISAGSTSGWRASSSVIGAAARSSVRTPGESAAEAAERRAYGVEQVGVHR